MAIKVGINGFGRIGRNIMRASLGHDDIDFVAVNDITSAETLAHLLKYDSVLGNLEADVEAGDGAISVDGDAFKVLSVQGPGRAALEGRWASTSSSSRPACSPSATTRPSTWRRARRRSIITAPAKGPDVTLVIGVNDEVYDAGEAPDHLERVVHDQLPGAGGQGAPRAVRHRQGLDDDDPLLHERPEPARPAAQGPAARARRGAVDDPDDDRRRLGARRGHPGAEGQARRLRDARADAERVGRRPRRAAREEDDRPRRSTRRSRRRPTAR